MHISSVEFGKRIPIFAHAANASSIDMELPPSVFSVVTIVNPLQVDQPVQLQQDWQVLPQLAKPDAQPHADDCPLFPGCPIETDTDMVPLSQPAFVVVTA
jgi:hypothetical protein